MKRRVLGAFGAFVLVACSGAAQEEDGWGETASGPHASMADDVLSNDGDVTDDELSTLDAPTDAEMSALDDDALVAPDDRADVALDVSLEIESACGSPGNYASWKQGKQLVTTEWLNLRAAPGTDSAIILVMPPSEAAVVLAQNCGHRWVHISDGSHHGYAAIDWLRAKTKTTPDPAWKAFYSPSRGTELADKAWHKWHGKPNVGYCLRGTRESIDASISPGFATGSPGASQFGDYALAHPGFMRNHHFKVYSKKDADAPAPKAFPKGTVIVWQHGHCGSDPTWGHVEVIVSETTACSDYCRKRSDQWCAPDVVILPRH